MSNRGQLNDIARESVIRLSTDVSEMFCTLMELVFALGILHHSHRTKHEALDKIVELPSGVSWESKAIPFIVFALLGRLYLRGFALQECHYSCRGNGFLLQFQVSRVSRT